MINTVNFGYRIIGQNTALNPPTFTGVPQTTGVPTFPGFPPVPTTQTQQASAQTFGSFNQPIMSTPPFNPNAPFPSTPNTGNILQQVLGGVANGSVYQGQPVYNIGMPAPKQTSLLENLVPALVGGGLGIITALIQKSSQNEAIKAQKDFREKVLETLSNSGANATTNVTVGRNETNKPPLTIAKKPSTSSHIVPTEEDAKTIDTTVKKDSKVKKGTSKEPKKPITNASANAFAKTSSSFRKLMT
ncbi:MAG: hypothetical protein ACKO37_07560 [Vampirovibrionales bacterium]